MKNKFDVCIVGGLGHVGLPLGIVFASKGLKVCLQDVNEKSANLVRKGFLPFIEYDAEPQNLKQYSTKLGHHFSQIEIYDGLPVLH